VIPTFDFSARRAELEVELEAAMAELPRLRAARQAAKTAAENGRYRFELFLQRLSAATRSGGDEAAPALLDLLAEERGRRDAANAPAERARRDLQNHLWKIAAVRLGLEQIDKLQTPPPLVPRREIMRRPKPEDLGDFDPDPIVVPARPPADAA
jgi:hypothetical protein